MKSLYRRLQPLWEERVILDSQYINNEQNSVYLSELDSIGGRVASLIKRYSDKNPLLEAAVREKIDDREAKPLLQTVEDYTCGDKKMLPGVSGRHFKRVNSQLKRTTGKRRPLDQLFFPRLTQKAYDAASAKKVDEIRCRAEFIDDRMSECIDYISDIFS